MKTTEPVGLAGAGGTGCLTNYCTTSEAMHRVIVASIPVLPERSRPEVPLVETQSIGWKEDRCSRAYAGTFCPEAPSPSMSSRRFFPGSRAPRSPKTEDVRFEADGDEIVRFVAVRRDRAAQTMDCAFLP